MRSMRNDGFVYKGNREWRWFVSLRSRLNQRAFCVTTTRFQARLMMNMRFIGRLSIAVGGLFLSNVVVAVPRWSATTEQVGGAATKPTTPNDVNLERKDGVTNKGRINLPNDEKAANIENTLQDVQSGRGNESKIEKKDSGEVCKTDFESGRIQSESERCFEPEINPDGPRFKTFSEAVESTRSKFGDSKTEMNFLVLQEKYGEKRYFVDLKAWYTDEKRAKSTAPGHDFSVVNFDRGKYKVVADIHNHPDDREELWEEFLKKNSDPERSPMTASWFFILKKDNIEEMKKQYKEFKQVGWFSRMDAISAKGSKIDSVVYLQATGNFLRLRSSDGRVTKIDDDISIDFPWRTERRFEYTFTTTSGELTLPFFPEKFNGKDDHSPYDPNEWGALPVKDGIKPCSGISIRLELMGVRGWCKCDPHERGVVYHVGEGVHTRNRLILIGDYEYSLCSRCGRVIKPSGPEGNDHGIIDQRIAQKFEKLRQRRSMKTSQIEALNEQMDGQLRQANEKLLSIPDGSVIAPGLCKCQIPDPIQVGWGITDEDDFYVCNFCGRIREPDSTGGIALGPTKLHEMGLMNQENKMWKRISQLAETNEVNGK